MTYLISDIHGEYDLFLRLLDKIKFSGGDRLISCGDIIDKGDDSVRLLKYIMAMPNAKCINGNHEYDFLKLYWGLMRQNGNDFGRISDRLRACFPRYGELLDEETVKWVESLPYYIKEEEFICVHAGLPLDGQGRALPPSSATREQLVYDRNFKDPQVEVKTDKCIFYGHTPSNYILNGPAKIIAYRRRGVPADSHKIGDFYKIHLDTGVWIGGVLGCFCLENCKAYYVKK